MYYSTAKEKARLGRTRKVLRDVVRLLNKDDRELWNILTALRGPDEDNDGEDLKRRTTCQIRRLIGMNEGACGTLQVTANDTLPKPHGDKCGVGHFANHYRRAVESLEKLGYKFKLR